MDTKLLESLVQQSAVYAAVECPPVSLEGAHMAKQNDAACVLQHAEHGSDSKSLLRKRQLYALLRKNASLPGIDPEARRLEAIAAFQEQQDTNLHTNLRLLMSTWADQGEVVSEIIGMARLELFRLLGPCPGPDDWEAFGLATVFSGGTVQGLARSNCGLDVDPYAKLSPDSTITSSRECLEKFGPMLLSGAFGDYLSGLAQRGLLKLEEVDFSRIGVVRKDSTKDRVIGVEPILNLMAQHGCANMLRPHLKSWGITLTDQTGNQKMARSASRYGFHVDGHGTIDLTQASDSQVVELIRLFFPDGWFELLDACRTKYYELEGIKYPSHTFSTMGNAFTFPLQCLVFAAIIRAAIAWYGPCKGLDHKGRETSRLQWRVYGDDLVVPIRVCGVVVETLVYCGFRVNQTKSFITGFFRESCGGDYLAGDEVSPAYLKEDINLLTERHRVFNLIQRKDPGHPILETLLYSVPKRKRFLGPDLGPYALKDVKSVGLDVDDDGNVVLSTRHLDVEHAAPTSHFVAPVWVLRAQRPWVCDVRWNAELQCYSYKWTGLFPHARKVLRIDAHRRYLCALLGHFGERHGVRGSVQYAPATGMTATPWVSGKSSPIWYEYQG